MDDWTSMEKFVEVTEEYLRTERACNDMKACVAKLKRE